MKTMLMCTGCSKTFVDPRKLPCRATICSSCIRRLYDANTRGIMCCACHKFHAMPASGNFPLCKVFDHLLGATRASSATSTATGSTTATNNNNNNSNSNVDLDPFALKVKKQCDTVRHEVRSAAQHSVEQIVQFKSDLVAQVDKFERSILAQRESKLKAASSSSSAIVVDNTSAPTTPKTAKPILSPSAKKKTSNCRVWFADDEQAKRSTLLHTTTVQGQEHDSKHDEPTLTVHFAVSESTLDVSLVLGKMSLVSTLASSASGEPRVIDLSRMRQQRMDHLFPPRVVIFSLFAFDNNRRFVLFCADRSATASASTSTTSGNISSSRESDNITINSVDQDMKVIRREELKNHLLLASSDQSIAAVGELQHLTSGKGADRFVCCATTHHRDLSSSTASSPLIHKRHQLLLFDHELNALGKLVTSEHMDKLVCNSRRIFGASNKTVRVWHVTSSDEHAAGGGGARVFKRRTSISLASRVASLDANETRLCVLEQHGQVIVLRLGHGGDCSVERHFTPWLVSFQHVAVSLLAAAGSGSDYVLLAGHSRLEWYDLSTKAIIRRVHTELKSRPSAQFLHTDANGRLCFFDFSKSILYLE